MRTTSFWLAIAAAGAIAYAAPLPGAAQQPADAAPPPQLEKLDERDVPVETSRPPEPRRQVDEKRAPGGRVTDITVGSGKGQYHLKPSGGSGYTAPDTQGGSGRAAQWEIMKFDLRRPKKQAAEGEAGRDVPPPPAPPAK